MFEKNLTIVYLLDFYGEVLAERTRAMLEAYYAEDMSLAEIAVHEGISRQGVRHMIKKGEEELSFLEEKLGLARQFSVLYERANCLLLDAKALKENKQIDKETLVLHMEECAQIILSKK